MEVTDWLLDGDPAIRWQVLRDLGLDPASPAARETISLVAANCRWEHDGQAFFDGEVEACNNGRTLSIGAYFDADVDGLVTGLLDDQLEDGGWNCWTEQGATVSSFDSTICVLEGPHLRRRPDRA